MLLALLVGSLLFANFINVARVPNEIADWFAAMNAPPLAVVIVCIAIYILLGCILESISMMLLTVPVFYPVMQAMGLDLVWFGIVVVVVIENQPDYSTNRADRIRPEIHVTRSRFDKNIQGSPAIHCSRHSPNRSDRRDSGTVPVPPPTYGIGLARLHAAKGVSMERGSETLFERLKASCRGEWRAYTNHEFVCRLGNGTLLKPVSATT